MQRYRYLLLVPIMTLLSSVVNAAGEPLLSKQLRTREDICRQYGPRTATQYGPPQTLTIGYRSDAAPFSTVKAGQVTGYVVDLCVEIARRVVGEEKIRFQEVSAVTRFADLAAGRIDLLCDSSTLTLERAACFDHSLLTFPSGPALAIADRQKKNGVSSKIRVGVLAAPSSTIDVTKDQITLEHLTKILGTEDIDITPMGSYRELFAALDDKDNGPARLDAILADREILLEAQKEKKGQPFTVSDDYLRYEPYTIYLRTDRDLLYFINAALVDIYSSPDIHRILNRHFASLSPLVGQMIVYQRYPRGKIYSNESFAAQLANGVQ